ncbi:cyclodeaminase [Francisellaceae bacterium]|nr:cyclodeaminase [Francisellaceae bacterium]
MNIEIIQESELKEKVTITTEALLSVEQAFVKLAEGKVTMPPVMHLDIKEFQGEVDVKSAYIHGLDKFVIKQSSGFFNNPKKGLPSSGGLMIVIDATTGFPCALLLDNGYLTDIRTALAGAISAKYLANDNIHSVGVIGSGNQAKYQLKALKLVRDYKEVIIYARDTNQAKAYKSEMENILDCSIKIASSPEEVAKSCQLLVTTTPATTPYILHEYLHKGLHITAMGSDAAVKNEIDARCFNHFDRIICDTVDQSLVIGECHHAHIANTFNSNKHKVLTLGEIIKDKPLGRQSKKDITLCDLTGTGAQDTAIAKFALEALYS